MKFRSIKVVAGAVLGLAAGAVSLRSQVVPLYWLGDGATGDVRDSGNWGMVPVGDGTEDVTFANITESTEHVLIPDDGTLGGADPIGFHNVTFANDFTPYLFSSTTDAPATLRIFGDITSIENYTAPVVLDNTLTIALSSGAHTVDIACGSSIEVDGAITEIDPGASLIKRGGGSLLLYGDSTFTGGVWVKGGTLVLGSSSTVDEYNTIVSGPVGTGTLTMKGGTTLAIAACSEITLDNDISLCGGSCTVTFDSSDGTLTLNGYISGGVAATKVGSGTLVLNNGLNDFYEGLTVSAGTLVLGASSSTDGEEGYILSGPAGTGTLTLQGGTTLAIATCGDFTFDNDISLDGEGCPVVFDSSNGTLRLNGYISGYLAAAKTGSGTLVLNNGYSDFYNGFTVREGTLVLGASSTYDVEYGVVSGPVGTGTLTMKGGTTLAIASCSEITLDNDISLCGGSCTVTFDSSNGTLTLNGELYGSLPVAKTGSGTLVLNNRYSYFSGGLTVSEGTVLIGDSSGAEGGTIYEGPVGTSDLTLLDGTTLGVTPYSDGIYLDNAIAVDSRSETNVTIDTSNGDLTLYGNIYGAADVTATGGHTLTLDGDNSGLTGDFYIAAGTVNFLTDTAAGSGALEFGSLGGTANFLSCNPIIYGLSGDSFLDVVSLSSWTQLTIDQCDTTTFPGTITGGGSLVKAGGGTLILTGANDYTGTTTITGGVIALGGSGTISGANLSLGGPEGTGVLAAQGSFSRNFGFGDGEVNISGEGGGFSAYGGPLTLALSGTWQSTPGFLSDANGGALVFGDTTVADNVVTWTGNIDLGGATRTIVVNDNPNSTADYAEITGIISNGGLVKDGDGTLKLSGTNTYAGGTEILGGTLVAGSSQAFGSGPITLNGGILSVSGSVSLAITLGPNGGVLSGNGTITSAIAAGNNVVLSPGNSPGNLSFSAGLTLASGGTIVLQVQDANGVAGVGYDLLTISGAPLDITATSGSPFTVIVQSLDGSNNLGAALNFNPASSYSWTIATSAAGITNFAPNAFTFVSTDFTNTLGGTFALAQSGNDLLLNFTPAAVPEPSTWALLLTGAGVTGLALRRRRSSAR